MPSIFDGIDMGDPCAVAPKMEEVLNRLLAGEQVIEMQFGTDRKRWQPSDVPALRARVQELRAACAARGNPHRADLQFVRPRYQSGW